MRKLIHKYLTVNYYVKGSKLYTSGELGLSLVSSNTLISDLEVVFGLSKQNLKWFVKAWIHKQNRGFPFRSYWSSTNIFNFSIPIIRQVSSTLISNDIVNVVPMSGPRGILTYLDTGYVYAPYIPVLNSSEAVQYTPQADLASRYSKKMVNSKFFNVMNYGSSSTTNIETPSFGKNFKDETIKKWKNFGLLET